MKTDFHRRFLHRGRRSSERSRSRCPWRNQYFTYNTKKADEKFAEANVEKYSLCSVETMIDTAVEEGYIQADEGEGIISWLREI